MYETLADSLIGTKAPLEITSELALINVPYIDFDGALQTGQIVINHELCGETKAIFAELCNAHFSIQKIRPILAYGWDDEASMADNNTSAFNYRKIIGTDQFSNHSTGRAIDINPLLNPYFALDGKVYPPEATYDVSKPGTITPDSVAVAFFKQHGWEWGGDWTDRKDYQHFEKK